MKYGKMIKEGDLVRPKNATMHASHFTGIIIERRTDGELVVLWAGGKVSSSAAGWVERVTP